MVSATFYPPIYARYTEGEYIVLHLSFYGAPSLALLLPSLMLGPGLGM